MPKNGSNARKTRVRGHAAHSGKTYRQAARELDDRRSEKDLLRQRIERYDPEELADCREVCQLYVAEADLPESVKVCLYALSERFGTARLIDPMGVRCKIIDLAAMTGLTANAASLSMHLAEAHGWATEFHDNEVRLKVPSEDIALWEHSGGGEEARFRPGHLRPYPGEHQDERGSAGLMVRSRASLA
jgi:hypothetical protein